MQKARQGLLKLVSGRRSCPPEPALCDVVWPKTERQLLAQPRLKQTFNVWSLHSEGMTLGGQFYKGRVCAFLPSIIERMRAAIVSIGKGLVRIAMPGPRCPLLRIAFSA